MRTFIFLFLVFLLGITHAQESYIQVVAAPEVSVFLDGIYKGKTTSELGGLIIENVSAGRHTIKVVKEGYNPQQESITVSSGQVFTYKVNPFKPKIHISQEGETGQQQIDIQVGELKIQSLPVDILISIPGLGVNSSKTQDVWKADKVPAGTYRATFKWKDKILNETLVIENNQTRHLFVNLIRGKIEDRTHYSPVTEKERDKVPILFNPDKKHGTMTDARDGKTYKTILIGNQIWMAQNLNVGTKINSTTGGQLQTDNGVIEKYCYNNDESNCDIYGGLYEWPEMMQYVTTEGAQGICPDGWHIPTDDEWKILEGTVDSQYGVGDPEWDGIGWRGYDAGENLKSTSGWYGNGNGTDLYGFTGLPGGYRLSSNGSFDPASGGSGDGLFWSSSQLSTNRAWYRLLGYYSADVGRGYDDEEYGCSVRCLKDY